MVNQSRWSLKIVALLHDPPDKPFAIEGHRNRAEELTQKVLGREVRKDEKERVEKADRIASAADRVDFPERDSGGEYLEAYWHKRKAVLIHPLSGRELDLGMMADVSAGDTHDAALRAIGKVIKNGTDAQRHFLQLWRQLPDILAKEYPRVGKLFGMLPAETRQPDHPLHQHLCITAAISDALPRPSLLVFSIGPVQEFIATARRTQDLWMGSYLLSYLTWVALQSIAENYGPDAVVFPALRGQPLCDLWLYKEKVLSSKPSAESFRLATLPNKFIALLPAADAKEAAQAATKAVRDEWQRLTDEVRKAMENNIVPIDPVFRQMWQAQISMHLEVYWVVLPWAEDNLSDGKAQADAVKSLFERLCAPQSDWQFDEIYSLFVKPREEGGGRYHPNWGTTYSLLYTLADRAFNARKSLRDFEPAEEKGEKCTVCGQRSVLHEQQKTSRDEVRKFWGVVARRVQDESRKKGSPFRGHHAAFKNPNQRGEGRERLCAVCTVKRLVQPLFFRSELGLHGGFPSTSEAAVASFKQEVLLNLSRPELFATLKTHVELLQRLGFEETVAEEAIPSLWKKFANVPGYARDTARGFLRYDGELFFEETFTAKRLQDDYGLSKQDAEAAVSMTREALNKFLTAAKEATIQRPWKYYAVLHMDGDHAGKWLAGLHKGLTCFRDVFHPDVRQQLECLPEWAELLKQKRLMTPALHAAISEALANFSLKLVCWVVEERHAGRVVYAGGDDVLALLTLDDVLSAARELRALFSGEVGFVNPNLKPSEMDLRNRDWSVTLGDPERKGYLFLDGAPLLTMGPTATASIGIAIAHHTQPLDAALQAARDADRDAKDLYNRNALCVYLVKRSGEQVRVGSQWFYLTDSEILDTIALIEEFKQHLAQGARDGKGLSMKLGNAVFDEACTLAHVGESAQRAELHRLILRHTVGFKPEEQKERKNLADDLSHRFVRLSTALQRHRDDWEKDWNRKHGNLEPSLGDEAMAPQPSILQLAHWLLLARFLSKGGEE